MQDSLTSLILPGARDDADRLAHIRRIALTAENVTADEGVPEFLNLPEDLLAEADYQLFLWVTNARDSTGAYAAFSAQCNQSWARAICPDLQRWSPRQRRAWLSGLRWRAFYDTNTTLRLRLATLRLILNHVSSYPTAIRGMAQYGFGVPETRLYMALLKDEEALQGLAKALKGLSAPAVLADLSLDPEVVTRQMNEDFIKYKMRAVAEAKVRGVALKNGKRVHLSFVAKHNNMSMSDLAAAVYERAIGYYIAARPFKSRLHAINVGKSAMEGGVLQAFDYWTDKSRSRLDKAGNSSVVTTVSLHDNGIDGEIDRNVMYGFIEPDSEDAYAD